ncbi:MAG TPA: SRPBCC family protein [Mycobacteriales bacterium]
MSRSPDSRGAPRLARALGFASLGLGAAQLAMPRRVAKAAGVDDSATAHPVIVAVGARELVHAAGLLGSRKRRGTWATTRVLGDALDLAVLGAALRGRSGERRRRVTLATAAVAGITALDVVAAVKERRAGRVAGGPQTFTASITVNKPRQEVYRYWRALTNLPTFMTHLVSVEATGAGRSRWTATGPAGKKVTWDAEVTDDTPGRAIAWRSLPGATAPNRGVVRFADAPGGRGTEVRVELTVEVPGGLAGRAVALLFGENPEQQVRDDLRRFKQVLETGEVVRSDGTPQGTRASRHLTQRVAEPAKA